MHLSCCELCYAISKTIGTDNHIYPIQVYFSYLYESFGQSLPSWIGIMSESITFSFLPTNYHTTQHYLSR